MKVTFKDIAASTGGALKSGNPNGVATGVSTDSREIIAGDAFFALKGSPEYAGCDVRRTSEDIAGGCSLADQKEPKQKGQPRQGRGSES